MALVTVLLLLATMLVLALALQLAATMDAMLARNQLLAAQAAAAAEGGLTHALLVLEARIAAGESLAAAVTGLPGPIQVVLLQEDAASLTASVRSGPVLATAEATVRANPPGIMTVLYRR